MLVEGTIGPVGAEVCKVTGGPSYNNPLCQCCGRGQL